MKIFGEECWRCGKRTRQRDEGLPTCAACLARLRAAKEPAIPCPADGTTLQKEVVANVVLDQCPKCRGVWLEAGELELIQRAAANESFVTGLVVGIPL